MEENNTKFSGYFAEALRRDPPVAISVLDEFINARLEQEDDPSTRGHKQMVQLDKRVNKPFVWGQ